MSSRPVHEIRLGRIKAAIFENGDDAPNRVTFSRLYKDEETWKSTSSFTREDLPLLMKVADRVHSHLYE
ncbi:MAG: hypothetical protein KDB23_12410 [Planctomycetales bacterium]|nr:hypothetical protein [Planctomycetales bacterium]